ncbi:MAG: hypothetical protein KAZ87_07620 [Spirochaetes bacterium]|nr:hypothetical protein [Spirochaetota bacterium]
MRKLMILIPLMIASCSMFKFEYRHEMNEDKKEIIKKSALSIGLGVGFDTTYDTDFFFFTKEVSPVTVSFTAHLDSLPDETAVDLYVDAYRINESSKYLMNHYKRLKKWREYNFFKTDVSEANEKYYTAIDAYSRKRFASEMTKLEELKQTAAQKGILNIQEKENVVDSY